MIKRIMCYGDSLTWGYVPKTGERFDENTRWTRVCGKDLGEDYEIIEEGLSGRTTVCDIPWAPYNNGLDGFPYACLTNKPLDMIVVFLGTNDILRVGDRKLKLQRAMEDFINHVVNANVFYSKPIHHFKIYRDKVRVLMVIPMPRGQVQKNSDDPALRNCYEKSIEMQEVYKQIAEDYGIDYIFASDFVVSSEIDGTHLDGENHIKLGHAIANKIKEIFAREEN